MNKKKTRKEKEMLGVKKWVVLISLFYTAVQGFTPEVSSVVHDTLSNSLLYFDDSSNVLNLNQEVVTISKDDGKTWERIDDLPGTIVSLWSDSIDRNRAFAFTSSNKHYITTDKGSNWRELLFDVSTTASVTVQTNFANSKLLMVTIQDCSSAGGDPFVNIKCSSAVFYTEDGFDSAPKKLSLPNVRSCTFVKTNENFVVGDDKRILCTADEYDSFNLVKLSTTYESSDWFTTSALISDTTGTLSSSLILELKVVDSFIVAIVQTDRYDKSSQVDFYVSKDGSRFRKLDLNVDMRRAMYVLLPSTPNSLHIAVWSYKNSMDTFPLADLYRSDSSGLFFAKSAASVLGGILGDVAADRVQNIDGAWISNEVLGVDAMGLPNLKSRISIDDGITWEVLKVTDQDCSNDEKCSLNILTSQERDGEGKLVTGPTPGILMAVGSVGLHGRSNDLSAQKTYISRDGGLQWKETLSFPAAFSFGDQGNIILAFPYMTSLDGKNSTFMTKEIYFSLDQGDSWEQYSLDKEILPVVVTTTIDGSSSKFIVMGLFNDDDPSNLSQSSEVIYALDFSNAFDGKVCGDDDFEEWYARSPDGKDGTCLFGHKEKFNRRKQTSKCLVNKLFDDVKVIEESCECSATDYECSLGFVKNDSGECTPDTRVIAENFCSKSNNRVSIPVHQKIPGSLCKGGVPLNNEKQDFNCRDILDENKSISISTKVQSFHGSIVQYNYLRQATNTTSSDETLVVLTSEHTVYYSYDGGESFYKFDTLEDKNDEFVAMYLNPYFPDQVYLVTSNSKIYISQDRAITFSVHKTPADVSEFGSRMLSFNKNDPLKFIWYGEKNCENIFAKECKSIAYHTENGGDTFFPLAENVRSCYYVGTIFDSKRYAVDENLIYCEQKVQDRNYLSLISSNDNFDQVKDVVFERIVGIAVTGRFVVVASINGDGRSLEAHVTVDGKEFADALFPPDFHVDRQQAYTIIDSSTGALFIHVTTNAARDGELGTILKSNSNGTSYVKSVDNVNRNRYGYVDYEKVEGLEGVSLINVVANADQVVAGKGSKQLKSMITYNDGSEWTYLTPPLVDSDKKKYSCSGNSLERCSLNLHGFTERADLRDTYSSGSAIGMLIGVGNVGSYLMPFNDESTGTFMTKDGGLTWKEIKKGNFMWEFGDQGTIVVLAPSGGQAADYVSYSLDEGETWNDFKFSEEKVTILDLATVPSDTARRFLLFGVNSQNVLVAYSLDFTQIYPRQCKLDLDDPTAADFEYWTPKHPFLLESCLFGHEAMYLRRSAEAECFIGLAPLNNAYKQIRNCLCSRRDFECDYNYVRSNDGTCKLVPGLAAPDNSDVCSRDDSLTEYWEPTGYRKIPLSTCEGGMELDKWISHPCPGKESEYRERYSISGAALFITIFVPLALFFGVSWFVYDRGIRRNGGLARFGEIRLDEDDFHPIENNRTDKVVNDIVKGIILSIGAVITLRSLLRAKIIGLFTRRNRYERVFGQDHDAILDDDSLFNFNDIDNDDDAREIDSFIQQDDDDFNTVAAGEEYRDSVKDTDFHDEEDDLTNQSHSPAP